MAELKLVCKQNAQLGKLANYCTCIGMFCFVAEEGFRGINRVVQSVITGCSESRRSLIIDL